MTNNNATQSREDEPSPPPRPDTGKGAPPSRRPIPDEAFWAMLIDAYKQVKKDTDSADKKLFQAQTNRGRCGFNVSFEVKYVAGKGRGIFAKQDIPKGTCVLDDRSGRFRTEKEWRDFLALLPPSVAREVVDWSGVDEWDHDAGDEVVFLGFCESSMLNHGFSKKSLRIWERLFPMFSGRKVTANLKGKEFKDDTWHLIATRNIRSGEELLIDYNEAGSAYEHSLPWYDTVYAEYYPGRTVKGEVESWHKGGTC